MNNAKASVRVGFLASHNGSAIQRIMERSEQGPVRIAPTVLITNNSGAACRGLAEKYHIPFYVINKTTVGEEKIDQSIRDTMIRHGSDFLIMAGYMKKLGPLTLQAFSGRILNSHPALLPKFGGKGMYGRHVHEAVIAAKDKESGVTIHLADEDYDTGPIVTQIKLSLSDNETVQSLEDRVKALEADAYLKALGILIAATSPIA